jgi:hypothetical protein
VLAPGAFLFMAGMFAGGIPTAWLWYRGRADCMLDVIKALVLGLLFGWALHKAGLTHYARIVNVYRLRDMTVMRFMLTALAVGCVRDPGGHRPRLRRHRARARPPRCSPTSSGAWSSGWAWRRLGFCPGTIVAEAGEGRLDAWVAGLSGLVRRRGGVRPASAHDHAAASPASAALGRVTFASLAGANPWLVLLVFGQAVALVLILIARVGRAPT